MASKSSASFPDSVVADFYYREPGDFGLQRQFPYQPYKKQVINARREGVAAAHGLGIDTSFFELVHHETSLSCDPDEESAWFGGQKGLEAQYYGELEDLLKKRTGAQNCIVLGHITRNVEPPAPGAGFSASSAKVEGGKSSEQRPPTSINGSVNVSGGS